MNSKIYKVKNHINQKMVFLGAGPMSLMSTDIIIELANHFGKPIALIPSRRQVECAELGGGYVNNWSTEEFAQYVKAKDSGLNVVLSRDHCGPWQQANLSGSESQNDFKVEMDKVKTSLRADIVSGFDLIHLDPSLAIRFGFSKIQLREIIYELIDFCESVKPNYLGYEIGTEEQDAIFGDSAEMVSDLQETLTGIQSLDLPKPLFVVQQTGTKVQELRNVGGFDWDLDVKGSFPTSFNIPRIVKTCENLGVWLKAHNVDYLGDEAKEWHRRFGIHAANVAPEFGTVETKSLIELSRMCNNSKMEDEFAVKVLSAGKWKKWMAPNSKATDSEKVLIGGHYHFSDQWCVEWREKLFEECTKKSINASLYVYSKTKDSIYKYLKKFGY